jgi:hypothetical protein
LGEALSWAREGPRGVVAGSGKAIPAFEKIPASHPLLQTAEGELFRSVMRGLAGIAVSLR